MPPEVFPQTSTLYSKYIGIMDEYIGQGPSFNFFQPTALPNHPKHEHNGQKCVGILR